MNAIASTAFEERVPVEADAALGEGDELRERRSDVDEAYRLRIARGRDRPRRMQEERHAQHLLVEGPGVTDVAVFEELLLS